MSQCDRTQKGTACEIPQKNLCVDYRSLNSLIPPKVKANSTAECVPLLIPLPKIGKLYVMLQGSKVYSSLDCIPGHHYTALSNEAHMNQLSTHSIGKFINSNLKRFFSDWLSICPFPIVDK